MKVLVIGGTGMLGEPVARALLADGHTVRIMTRRFAAARARFGESAEVVAGDVEDPASIVRALDGCDGAHLSLDGRGDWDLERRAAENVAAVASDLERITMITGASVSKENSWFPMIRAKLAAEDALRAGGVPYTFFRCTMFMEMLPKLVRDGKAMVMGRQPAPWHFLAAEDYARMVSRAFATPAAAGKSLYVYGPEAFTIEEALERYRSICAPEAKLARVPFWVLSIVACLSGRADLRRVGLPIMRYFSRVKETGDPAEANELLGGPTTTLEEWCRAR